MDSNRMDIPLFFKLALQAVELISEWHQNQTIPRSMNPEHITLQMEGDELLLKWRPVDDEEYGHAYAYLSPEHGGRMTRQPDLRSELYGIGILFYEWLTGEFPFQASTLNEWIHAHMAVLPEPPLALQPRIPQQINDLVMKLLSKAPTDRYQSARGLQEDLLRCADQWTKTGEIERFPLGELDERSVLRLPSQLYGRSREWQQLLDVYARVCSGSKELFFIGGHAGNGKSSLMRALREYVSRDNGIFVYGKSESIRESKPYAPLIAAVTHRLRQLLASGDAQVERWKAKITKILGRSGSVLTQVIPELTWLVGELSPVEALPPAEAMNRFRKLFGNLIQAFASKQHPLIIGLDDLQWADSASLHLLRDLWQQSSLRHVMIIGAYREDEVDERHELHPWLLELSLSDAAGFQAMKLHALSYSDVTLYLSETLNADPDELKPLTDILYQQTAGNPLYLRQMLQTCYDQKLLSFDFKQLRWQWELQAIKDMKGFQHVIDLIRSRIEVLPEETRLLLQRAGCLGAAIDIEPLSLIAGMDAEHVTRMLSPAVNEGWIVIEDEQLRFQHDQVQKVAYDLISNEEKKQVHLEIGRALLHAIPTDIAEDHLFQVVHHFNAGRAYMKRDRELDQLALMNLKAGRKAKSSAAYGQALSFFLIGAELVGTEGWSRSDGLYFQLVLERTECLYFSGDIGHAEADLHELLRHADDLSDRSRIYSIMIMMYSFHNRMNEAVDIAVLAMNECGLSMPSAASVPSMLVEIARTQLLLSRYRMRLDQLPINREMNHQALAQIVTVASSVIFIVNPALSIILFAKYVRLSLQHGLGDDAFSIALGSYAAAIGFGFGQYRTTARLIEIAWTYAEQSDSLVLRGKMQLYLGLAKQHFHAKEEVVSSFESAAQLSLECGDMVNAGNAIACHIITYDQDLRRLDQICHTYEWENAQWLNAITLRAVHITNRYIERLQRPLDDQQLLFHIADMPENDRWLEQVMSNEEKGTWYYLYSCKLEVAFVCNRYSDAVALAEQSVRIRRDVLLSIQQKHCFYYALSLMRMAAENARLWKGKQRRALRKQMNRMRRWTDASPKTLSKYRIMQAEYARLNRKYEDAVKLYDQAIHAARQAGDYRDEAIAAESAAGFYANRNDSSQYEHYLREACEAYNKWGATGKARSLQATVPALHSLSIDDWHESDKTAPETKTEENRKTIHMPPGASLSQDLDMEMLQQTARTFLDDQPSMPLSERFLQLALHTTGAERGLILLDNDGRFVIHTAIEINRKREDDPEREEPYSNSVVQFVHRTKEPIILGEALQSMFASDSYIQRLQAQSILCLPIHDSVHREGLVYLENNQTPDAFTPDRVDMLELIFSRMIYMKLWHLEDSTGKKDRQEDSPSSIFIVEALTVRELEVVKLMGEGLSNKQIALRLSITEGTVKTHTNNIYGKLQVNKRVQAINKAKELHLIT